MNQAKIVCIEYESEYYKDSSEMMDLCPDCAHKLYGFENRKCIKCSWNGQTSEFLKNREEKNGK